MSITGDMSVNDDKTKNYSVTAGRDDGENSVLARAFVNGYRDTPDPTKLNAPLYNVAGVSLNAANETGHAVSLKAQHIPMSGSEVTASSNVNIVNIDKHRFDVNAHSTATFPKNSPNYMTHGVGAEYMFKTGPTRTGTVGLKAQHIPTSGSKVTASSNVNVVNIDKHRFDVNAHSTANFPKNSPNYMTHGVGAEYMFKEKYGAHASVSHTPMFKQTDYAVGGSMSLHKTPTTSLDFNVGANKTVTPFHNGNWNKSGGFSFTKKF